jgi:predicted TIM-barrel fold metal-dependent hydrolase
MDQEWMGLKWRHAVGVDNLMFGTDCPHIGSFYPHDRFYIELAMQDVSYEEKEKILWSNGASLYGIDYPAHGESC